MKNFSLREIYHNKKTKGENTDFTCAINCTPKLTCTCTCTCTCHHTSQGTVWFKKGQMLLSYYSKSVLSHPIFFLYIFFTTKKGWLYTGQALHYPTLLMYIHKLQMCILLNALPTILLKFLIFCPKKFFH